MGKISFSFSSVQARDCCQRKNLKLSLSGFVCVRSCRNLEGGWSESELCTMYLCHRVEVILLLLVNTFLRFNACQEEKHYRRQNSPQYTPSFNPVASNISFCTVYSLHTTELQYNNAQRASLRFHWSQKLETPPCTSCQTASGPFLAPAPSPLPPGSEGEMVFDLEKP
jgi:hypothetical protein